MARPEQRVQDYCRDYFKQRGWAAYRMDQGGGVADFLFVSPKGTHMWVEFKRPGKDDLDPAQIEWRRDMENRVMDDTADHIIIVGPVNCRDDVRALYEQYRHW